MVSSVYLVEKRISKYVMERSVLARALLKVVRILTLSFVNADLSISFSKYFLYLLNISMGFFKLEFYILNINYTLVEN